MHGLGDHRADLVDLAQLLLDAADSAFKLPKFVASTYATRLPTWRIPSPASRRSSGCWRLFDVLDHLLRDFFADRSR